METLEYTLTREVLTVLPKAGDELLEIASSVCGAILEIRIHGRAYARYCTRGSADDLGYYPFSEFRPIAYGMCMWKDVIEFVLVGPPVITLRTKWRVLNTNRDTYMQSTCRYPDGHLTYKDGWAIFSDEGPPESAMFIRSQDASLT
jgi:hypothetical protein